MISTTEPHDPSAGCEVPRAHAWFSHCHPHAVDEPWDCDTFRVCAECGHVFPTGDALVADRTAVVARLNAEALPFTPYMPDEFYAPMVAETDPEQITACAHCDHDWRARLAPPPHPLEST